EGIPAAADIVNLRYKSCSEMEGQDHVCGTRLNVRSGPHLSVVYFICLLCAAIHAIGYELVDNGLSYFNTAMATELGHFNDCDRIL
ncbi:hypothetical protein, partial [Klebsiella pasteurii]|uniref:hypothetical protein n=1 Tax=Klebsiella pasteurii TaxID=2587529 RepID=UPI00292EA0AF